MTKELFAATACSKVWKIIEASPFLTAMEKNISVLWDKSQLLVHPYVRLDRGFVFIHVPKTAGTSLNKALGLNATLATSLHAHARDVLPFIKIIAPEVISIAFVRNPYARFVSLYDFARADETLYHSTKNPERVPYGKHLDYDILSDKSLEECAELLVEGKLGNPRPRMNIWRPQVEWLTDRNGKLMIDYIGHVESMDSDLQRLKKLYGIVSEPVSWLNKSGDKEKAPQFNERALELIRLYYKRDFEMLGYDEKLLAPAVA
jgi:hypothetical protein